MAQITSPEQQYATPPSSGSPASSPSTTSSLSESTAREPTQSSAPVPDNRTSSEWEIWLNDNHNWTPAADFDAHHTGDNAATDTTEPLSPNNQPAEADSTDRSVAEVAAILDSASAATSPVVHEAAAHIKKRSAGEQLDPTRTHKQAKFCNNQRPAGRACSAPPTFPLPKDAIAGQGRYAGQDLTSDKPGSNSTLPFDASILDDFSKAGPKAPLVTRTYWNPSAQKVPVHWTCLENEVPAVKLPCGMFFTFIKRAQL